MIVVEPKQFDIVETNLSDTEKSKLVDGLVTNQASIQANEMVVTFVIDGSYLVYLANISGASKVIVEYIEDDGTIFDSSEVSLEKGGLRNIWDYFYNPLLYADESLLVLKYYKGKKCRIRLQGNSGEIKLGEVVYGFDYKIGRNEYATSVGLHDYSTVNIDNNGELVISNPKKMSNLFSTRVFIEPTDVDRLLILFKKLKGKRCLWVGSVKDNAKIVFGYFKNFRPVYKVNGKAMFTLEVEGAV